MAGPFYFHWVPGVLTGVPAWDRAFAVEDEQIFSIVIDHEEGNFASLTIELVNPKVGLLAAGRNLWAWLAWDSSPAQDGSAIAPVFCGRLVGIPVNLDGEVVSLEFLAMPQDYTAQVTALAASMMVLPYWDPIWIQSGINDPDTVLETYSALWHIDRVTLQVTASDIIEGEDGLLQVLETDHFYDDMTVSYGPTPITSITVTGTVTWDQVATGEVDLTADLVAAFQAAGSPVNYPLISTMTPGLYDSWPRAGTNIGGGWTVGPSSYIAEATWLPEASLGVHWTAQQTPPTPTMTRAELLADLFVSWSALYPLNIYQITFTGYYSADRARSEIVQFTLNADVQPLVSLSGVPIVPVTLALSSDYVALPVDPGGNVPIGNPIQPTYFKLDRGQQSFQYLLLLARAQLLASARAVNISFATTWATALALTCRWSVQLYDRRLPGGSAIGKVTGYVLSYSSEGIGAVVKLGCTCGNGNSLEPVAGIAGWSDTYVGAGYQSYDGATIGVGDGAISYESFDDFELDDDGVDLQNMTAQNVLYGPVTTPTALDPTRSPGAQLVIPGGVRIIIDPPTIQATADPVAGAAVGLQQGTYQVVAGGAGFSLIAPNGAQAGGSVGQPLQAFGLLVSVPSLVSGTSAWTVEVIGGATEAEASGPGSGGVATTGLTNGKFYFEFTGDQLSSGITADVVGLAVQGVNAGGPAAGTYIGAEPGGAIYNGATSSGFVFDGWSANPTVWAAIAVDLDNGLFWVAANALDPQWNDGTTVGAGTQQPWDATLYAPQGGIPIDPSLAGQALFPFFSGGGTIQFNFGATSFAGAAPANFYAVDAAAGSVPNLGITIFGGVGTQKAAIEQGVGLKPPDPSGQLTANPTIVTVDLVPVVGGAFQTLFSPEVSMLMVPKTIDLQAPTAP
jgi:hypothetical protein